MRLLFKTKEEAIAYKKSLAWMSNITQTAMDIQQIVVGDEEFFKLAAIKDLYQAGHMNGFEFISELIKQNLFIRQAYGVYIWYDLETLLKLFRKYYDLPYWQTFQERLALIYLLERKISFSQAA